MGPKHPVVAKRPDGQPSRLRRRIQLSVASTSRLKTTPADAIVAAGLMAKPAATLGKTGSGPHGDAWVASGTRQEAIQKKKPDEEEARAGRNDPPGRVASR